MLLNPKLSDHQTHSNKIVISLWILRMKRLCFNDIWVDVPGGERERERAQLGQPLASPYSILCVNDPWVVILIRTHCKHNWKLVSWNVCQGWDPSDLTLDHTLTCDLSNDLFDWDPKFGTSWNTQSVSPGIWRGLKYSLHWNFPLIFSL
jgi:hypothetical protein